MWTSALSLIAVIIFTGAILPYAEAHHNMGIRLSDTCITLLKLNDTTCPSYGEIMTVFPDTSNRSISGDFALIDGIIQREPPQLTAHYEFYRHNTDEHLFIDPLIDGTFAMDIITIETQIPTYKTKDSHKIINGTITFGHSRMVDDSCMNASIAAGQWLTYLGDTINYMKNECDEEYTYMDTTKQIEHIQTAITDKMQFYQYQIEKWFKEMIHKCLSWKCL